MNKPKHNNQRLLSMLNGTRWTTDGMEFEAFGTELGDRGICCHARSGTEYFNLTLSDAIQSIVVAWVTEPMNPTQADDPNHGEAQ